MIKKIGIITKLLLLGFVLLATPACSSDNGDKFIGTWSRPNANYPDRIITLEISKNENLFDIKQTTTEATFQWHAELKDGYLDSNISDVPDLITYNKDDGSISFEGSKYTKEWFITEMST